MAGTLFTASSGDVALASATAKTCLQIKASASTGVYCKGFRVVGIQAAGGTDAAVKLRATRSTGSFGTATGAGYAAKTDPDRAVAIQATVSYNFTAEPTSPTDQYDYAAFNPESGFTEIWPRDLWLFIPAGAALNFELTAVSGTPGIRVTAFCEE